MGLLSQKTKQTLKDSTQTFVLCLCILVFALLLTTLEDFAIKTNRPLYVIYAIEYFAAASWVTDGLIFTSIVAKLIIRAYRDLKDEIEK
jgi:multisubunit Na+/H+ antiporter MnhE subunit